MGTNLKINALVWIATRTWHSGWVFSADNARDGKAPVRDRQINARYVLVFCDNTMVAY